MKGRLYDVIIAGAGPAGLHSARRCEELGLDILLIEEHKNIGEPPHCSGLISSNLASLVEMKKDFVEHEVKGAILRSPGGHKLKLEKKGTAAYVVDRVKFDRFLASCVSSKIEKGKISGFSTSRDSVSVRAGNKTYRSRLLIACDGPNSTIRKQMNQAPREMLNGIIATTGEKSDSGFVEMWYDRHICDGFMWRIPRGGSTEYGMMGSRVSMSQLKGFFRINGSTDVKGGMIPLGPPRTYYNRLLLVGDAAAQVKPWSGGGVIYSLTAAGIAASVCKQAVEAGDFSEAFLRRYEKLWKREIGSQIRAGMIGRRIYKHMDNRQIDIAMRSASRMRLLMNKLDMDFLVR